MNPKEAYEKYKKIKVPSLSEIRDTASKHSKTSLVIISLLVALLLLALQYIPHYQVSQFNITNQRDLADTENSYRITLAQTFGGIAIAIGLYYTWRRIAIAEEDLKATQENLKITQENLKVSQEGQITERFTRAIDQLGSDKLQIRLGGIYALERIANESGKDYWPIMEILTAYIRENSLIKNLRTRYREIENLSEESFDKKYEVLPDTQAILTILGRRKYSFKVGELFGLDLNGTHLRMVNLKGAHLEGAYLGYTDLIGAHLEKSNLIEANLENTYLNWGFLNEANLEGANFAGANLEGVDFYGANLEGVDFYGANLKDTECLTVKQLSKVKTLHAAKLDEDLEEELKSRYPHLFEFPRDSSILEDFIDEP